MNRIVGGFYKKALMLTLAVCIFIGFAMPAKAEEISFTKEEQEYLENETILKAASIDGVAPLHYRGSKGEIKGIAVNVLKEIANMTGITFEYNLYDSIEDVFNSEFDVIFGLSEQYTRHGIALSTPYLETETVLFYNKSIDAMRLEGKRYVSIKGGTLPEGVQGEQAIYFSDREATIDAVESGKADYGYGNAYSVAYYTLQNGYKNIYTIPTGKENRLYCMGVSEEDVILLSILNKAIAVIEKSRMDTLILDVASQVDRKITLPIIIEAYGMQIFTLIFLIMAVLTYFVLSSTRAKKRYEMENKRYHLLSQLSNEYLFEYQIKGDVLEVAEKLGEKLDLFSNKAEVISLIKRSMKELDNQNLKDNAYTIKLPLSDGGIGIFRVLFSYLRDESGRIHSVIGKFLDISEEEKDKKKLIAKSQMDGLTGLYNAATAKEMIEKSMSDKSLYTSDSLIIIDCDNFKEINDTRGHLTGDSVLKNISSSLKLTFRKTDIIGRMGGDEFCVYMQNIPSVEFAQSKCRQLVHRIRKLNKAFPAHISIGIAVLKEPLSYESLFKQADVALYVAKKNGGAQAVVYDGKIYGSGQ